MDTFKKPEIDEGAEKALKEQKQKEEMRLAEEKDAQGRRKARGSNTMGGLIKTGETGVQPSGRKVKLSGVV
jgi:hypothetical protein